MTELEKVVKEPRFSVTIDLNSGNANPIVYTTDLSSAFVDFNSSEYSAAIHPNAKKASFKFRQSPSPEAHLTAATPEPKALVPHPKSQ